MSVTFTYAMPWNFDLQNNGLFWSPTAMTLFSNFTLVKQRMKVYFYSKKQLSLIYNFFVRIVYSILSHREGENAISGSSFTPWEQNSMVFLYKNVFKTDPKPIMNTI